MYLTAEETAALLGVSTKWVRERMDAGDCQISRHLKCRRDTAPPRKADRSPVRIASADLARYILSNTREHGWSTFPEAPGDLATLEGVELRIWRYLLWYRSEASLVAKETPSGRRAPRKAAPKKATRRVS